MESKSPLDADEFMRVRLEGCRKGGIKSGQARLENSRWRYVEIAINSERSAGKWSRNSAARIAAYVGVSARYVRKVDCQTKKKGNELGSVPLRVLPCDRTDDK